MMPRDLDSAIKTVIQYRIEEEVKAQVKRAQDALRQKIPELVAGTTVEVLKRASMERLGEQLLITVDLKGLGR